MHCRSKDTGCWHGELRMSRILLVEDNEGTRFGFVRYFSREGYQVSEACNLTEATCMLEKHRIDAIVLDINLPDGNGLDFIASARASNPFVPIIVITGSGDVPLAVKAMSQGADNFLIKPVDNAGLALFLRKTLEVGSLKRKLEARSRTEKKEALFWGECSRMKVVRELAGLAAECGSPVLITGETGTGKGFLAKWIHENCKPRSAFEFVAVNCSALKGELLAREMFGNARGAYTSADQDRKGLLDIADRGTLFLDEIGDMGLEVQAQFLKVLEEKCYRRLGDVRLYKSDFRLICATNQDISQQLADGQFRQDLLYRINLIEINLPPLRERIEDISSLSSHLLASLGAVDVVLSDDVLYLLAGYSWPGNVRELRNVLERALLLSRGTELNPGHFAGLRNDHVKMKHTVQETVQEVEKRHILAVLEQMNGDVDKTAKSLNLSRATLYRRLKQIR
jgi:DNA-binding NtrC family response regulator